MSLTKRRVVTILFFACAVVFSAPRGHSFSLALDSVRTWGAFPRFCVDAYRWGDRFLNTYDTAYVEGTGFKFNVKNRTETWSDRYDFSLPNNYRLNMVSDQCASTGFYLTYLAVSVGYDLNVSKWFGNSEPARKRFSFSLNCSLLSADLYWISNGVSTHIREFGPANDIEHMDIRFRGIDTSIFGVSVVYYLNHKRYSQAAAFNYSRVQKRSQGSFYVGFNYWAQDFEFDFNQLPDDMKADLPPSWALNDYMYEANSRNYSAIVGYGYNWVFAPHWVLGVSESPIFGLKDGYINRPEERKLSFSLYNRARLSVAWSNHRWFAGAILKVENGLIYDKDHSLLNTVVNVEASVGFRFNIW